MNIFKFTSLLSLLFIFSCSADQKADKEAQRILDSLAQLEDGDTVGINLIQTEVPEDIETKNIWIEQVRDSPFYELGCCKEEGKLGEPCCCNDLIKKYKEIRYQDNDQLITQVKSEDPLFLGCKSKSKYRSRLEAIDSEYYESLKKEESEEEFDF